MARNQLPEGVGRKIVEALERQRKAEAGNKIRPELKPEKEKEKKVTVPETDNVNDSDFLDFIVEENPVNPEPEEVVKNPEPEQQVEEQDFESDEDLMETIPDFMTVEQENLSEDEQPIVYNEAPQIQKAGVVTEAVEPEPQVEVPVVEPVAEPVPVEQPAPVLKSFKVDTEPEPTFEKGFDSSVVTPKTDFVPVQTVKSDLGAAIQVPYNVAILNNLIAGLPEGISKQVGAQIIRQTLEATGMSMRKVLKEAQELQEQLNVSARDCMMKIQEYKSNILSLEQSVEDYQRNISQINELVSLFLVTGKK